MLSLFFLIQKRNFPAIFLKSYLAESVFLAILALFRFLNTLCTNHFDKTYSIKATKFSNDTQKA